MKSFGKFVSSPFFNTVKNNKKLLSELKRFHPDFESDKLTYEYLFGKIYPGKKYNKQMMWNLVSEMEKLAEGFIAELTLKKDEFERMKYIAEHYRMRNLRSNLGATLRKMDKFTAAHAGDLDYLYYLTELEALKKEYHHLEDKQYLLCENVLKFGEYHILLFLKRLSFTISDLSANSVMYNANYEFNIPVEFFRSLNLKSVIDYARKAEYKFAYLIELYCYLILTKLEPNESEHFFNLKKLFQENHNKLHPIGIPGVASSMANYCTVKISEGNSEYKRILFELFKYFLDEKVAINPYGHLPQVLFQAIFKSALDANEFEWARNFIKEYIPQLKQEFRKTQRALALAMLNICLKKYELALQQLNEIEFMDVKDKLLLKLMMVQIYYEMGDMETMMYQIDSAKHFLNKNKSVSEMRRNSYMKFYNSLTKLVSFRENGDKFLLASLIDKVKNDGDVSQKEWLLEKLNELK